MHGVEREIKQLLDSVRLRSDRGGLSHVFVTVGCNHSPNELEYLAGCRIITHSSHDGIRDIENLGYVRTLADNIMTGIHRRVASWPCRRRGQEQRVADCAELLPIYKRRQTWINNQTGKVVEEAILGANDISGADDGGTRELIQHDGLGLGLGAKEVRARCSVGVQCRHVNKSLNTRLLCCPCDNACSVNVNIVHREVSVRFW